MRLNRENAVLVIIDVQEKLLPVIDHAKPLVQNVERLIRGMHILGVPVVVTEQYVKGLGPTIAPLRAALEETGGYRPIEKACFSAHGCEAFAAQLAALERRQVIVAGVEAHVCVYQTVLDLLGSEFLGSSEFLGVPRRSPTLPRNSEELRGTRGTYDVTILADAVSSRTAQNKDIALRRMVAEGVKLSSTEMALFELTVASGTDEFRAISKLVK